MVRLRRAVAGGARPRRIGLFESQSLCSTNKKTTLTGGFLIGGECEIRTHGGSPHH